MADRYFNPFQAIDINVPVEFHFAMYVSRSPALVSVVAPPTKSAVPSNTPAV